MTGTLRWPIIWIGCEGMVTMDAERDDNLGGFHYSNLPSSFTIGRCFGEQDIFWSGQALVSAQSHQNAIGSHALSLIVYWI